MAGEAPPPPIYPGASAPAPPPPARPLPAVWTARPELVTCPGCGGTVTSGVKVNSCNAANWVLCLLTGVCCVFIPGCCNCASDFVHRCPNCDYALGSKSAC